MENLGNSNDQDAYVWKVEIQGTAYALKMASTMTAQSEEAIFN
jgi:hypothetical protein